MFTTKAADPLLVGVAVDVVTVLSGLLMVKLNSLLVPLYKVTETVGLLLWACENSMVVTGL